MSEKNMAGITFKNNINIVQPVVQHIITCKFDEVYIFKDTRQQKEGVLCERT